jgi:dUTPase
LTNTSDDYLYIYEDDKITQLAPRVYCTEEARIYTEEKVDVEADNKISENEFYKDFKYNNRGAGGFGSTGTKAK